MANLVPTPVVDKNGRLTTVHKRTEALSGAEPMIPRPMISSSLEMAARRERIISDLNVLTFIDGEDGLESINKTLDSYTPEFLEVVEDALGDEDTASATALLVSAGEPQHLVSESIEFLPHLEMNGFYEAFRLVSSLHHGYYPGLPPEDDYSRADERVRAQCLSLLKISVVMQNWAHDRRNTLKTVDVGTVNIDRVLIMSDERMIALALEQPEQADLVCDTIRERRTGDYGVIKSVLDYESIALSSGNL